LKDIILGYKVICLKNENTGSYNEYETVSRLLCELTRLCNIKEEYFASNFNLSPGELRLIKLFTDRNFYPIKELCALLNLTPGRITHLVTSLENKKLIKRKVNYKDKRNITVCLSAKSKKYMKTLSNSHIEFNRKILEHLSEKKMKTAVEILNTLVELLKQWVKNK